MLDHASLAAQSPPSETVTVAGVAIARLRFGGAGRPALYLHPKDGPGDDAAFLAALGEAGLAVHAPWLPGFGASRRPDDFTSVRDLACFAAAYLEMADLQGALVIGASFGGWVAAEMATRDVSRIAGLVLIDALGVKFAGPEGRDIADFHSLPPAALAARAWVDPAAHAPDFQAMSEAEAVGRVRSEEAFALYGWRPYMHDPGLKRWLGRSRLPASVIWGARDGVVAPDYGRAYAALLPGASFHLVADAAHYPAREQPQATAALVRRFAETL